MFYQHPVLYYLPVSPPARAVLLTANALGLELTLKPVDLTKGEHLTPEFVKMNPQHTIPVLDDNGTFIYDSHVICGYLIDKFAPGNSLYPTDLVKRSQIDARLHFDSGFLFSRMRFLYEPTLFHGSKEDPTEKIKYIQKCWDIMEAFLLDSPYVCGDEMTIADFSCISTISSVDEAAPIDSQKYPKLLAWMKRMSELPNYEKVNGVGAAGLKKFYADKRQENLSK